METGAFVCGDVYVSRDMSSSYHSHVSFVNTTIEDCNLSGAAFYRCVFTSVDFKHCNFQNTTFISCIFVYTNMWTCEGDYKMVYPILYNSGFHRHTGLVSMTSPVFSRFRSIRTRVNLREFPSLHTMAGIRYDRLPGFLVVELMLRDRAGHDEPACFDLWAKGGACPYTRTPPIERPWDFPEDRILLYHSLDGKPSMKDHELVGALLQRLYWTVGG